MPKQVPWVPDSSRRVEKPFDLMTWVGQHAGQLKEEGSVPLFDPSKYQSDVYVHRFGDEGKNYKAKATDGETFFWVLKGFAAISDGKTVYHLKFDDTLLMPKNCQLSFQFMSSDSAVLSTTMSPGNKSRVNFAYI